MMSLSVMSTLMSTSLILALALSMWLGVVIDVAVVGIVVVDFVVLDVLLLFVLLFLVLDVDVLLTSCSHTKGPGADVDVLVPVQCCCSHRH